MTLYWWMHWFWVTTLIVISLTTSISETTTSSFLSPITAKSSQLEVVRIQESYKIAKAIGIELSKTSVQGIARNLSYNFQLDHLPVTDSDLTDKSRPSTPGNRTLLEFVVNNNVQIGRILGKKENKITWVQALSKPEKPKYEEKTLSTISTDITIEDFMTVMPLRESTEESKLKILKFDPNIIRREKHQPVRNRSLDFMLGQQTINPNDVDASASKLDVTLGDSTRLGRARGTFTRKFQREKLSDKEHYTEYMAKSTKEIIETSTNVTKIATITGSCLAIIILLSIAGSLGFIMYRRKYLNPPQTLNSDKCSNPDSSGYIDDSTIRDNSEEMYSLDNDSFLNSLEAMTIQNYWTDSVKHTKL